MSMNDTFVDKKCTIYDFSTQVIDGTELPIKNVLYDLVSCNFGKSGITANNYGNSEPASQYDSETMEVVLNRGFELVRKGMFIDLYETPNDLPVLIGTFIIESVEFVKDWNGIIDNITLGAKQNNGESS